MHPAFLPLPWLRPLTAVLGLLFLLAPASLSVRAQADPPHAHAFGDPQDPPISDMGVFFSQATARPNQVVPVDVVYYAVDTDLCTNADGQCSWPYAMVSDNVHVQSLSASGGTLGTLDGYGQFQPLGPNQWPTHFRCGAATGTGTVTLTWDDDAQGPDPDTGQTIALNNDPADVLSASITIAAHRHEWPGTSDISVQEFSTGNDYPMTGERVALSPAGGWDWDTCEASNCPFSGWIENQVHVSGWSGAGTFGYYDATGQWTPSSDPLLVTHWQAPSTPGDVTLTLSMDDTPEAVNPETGEPEETFDDQPGTATHVVHVYAPPPPHEHTFGGPQEPPISTPYVAFGQASARPGQVVSLSYYQYETDLDLCRNLDGQCPWYDHTIWDSVHVSSFGASGGELGTLDEMGQFQPLQGSQTPTHFRCGSSAGTASVTVTLDDDAQGYDPVTGELTPCFDDPPASGTATLAVAVHVHQWDPANNIQGDGFSVNEYVTAGERVPVSAGSGWDYDTCTAENCPFGMGWVTNSVHASGWSGGTFGYYDAFGEWTPSSDPEQITHWEAPATPGDVTLTLSMDDTPEALNPTSSGA